MIKRLFPLLLSVIGAFGQVIHSGSSDDNFFLPAQGCTLTTSCTFTDTSVVPATVRYSNTATLNYDIPEANGAGILTLGFWEPSATKVGQRVFNIGVNGVTVATVDIFKQAGGQKRYWTMPPINVNVADGFVHVVLEQVTGKPAIATLAYNGLAVQGPKGDPGVLGPTGATGPIGPQGPAGMQGVPGPLPTFVCIPASACSFDPATNTFTITAPTTTAALPVCMEVAANTLGTQWATMTGNVYIAHVSSTAPLDCIPGPNKEGTVILNAMNVPIGTYFTSPL